MLQFVKTKQVSKEIENVKDTLLTADEPHSSQQGKSVPGQQSSMKAFTEDCSKTFEAVLTKLIEAKWRASSEADDLLEQYRSFLQLVKKECDSDFKNNKQ